MGLFGWTRVLMRQETAGFRWRPADVVLILWAISGAIAYTVQQGEMSAFIYRLGLAFDGVGMYFLFRFLIRDWDELIQAVKALCLIAIPVAIAFMIEAVTARNAFAVFGGVPEITLVREDRLRCQGAFSHPILAGCFWASLMPLMAALWRQPRSPQWIVMCGIGASLLVIIACASSTPVMAVLLAIVGAAMWPLRGSMRQLRWGIVGVLVILHFSMQAPVWHLISRIDVVGGSTGWHRYFLLDQAINHFSEWAMVGTPSTAVWGPGLQDVTNHFILEGVTGGAMTLLLFIIIIALCFRSVGQAWRANAGNRANMMLAWAIGVSLFVHCMNFLAVSYFGQIMMIWYFTLACATSLGPAASRAAQTVHAPSGPVMQHGGAGRRAHATPGQAFRHFRA
jgi:hypothetical protein